MMHRLGLWMRNPGTIVAIPPFVLFVTGFLAPLLIVLFFSFLPDRTFGYEGTLTLENYERVVSDNYYRSFLWSLALAALTVAINLVIGYPVAYGLAKMFGRWSLPITLLAILPLFIAENVRLFGWSMFLLKGGGVLAGTMNGLFGVQTGTMLYNPSSVLLGLVYTYLPFTMFPIVLGLSMVPADQVHAARDLGATKWQTMRDVELPIAMLGILIGALLTFILALGAFLENQILGAEAVSVIATEIQRTFSYAQNWPLGAAICILLIAISALLTFMVMRRVDLDNLLRRR